MGAIDINSRLELFVDDYIIAFMEGSSELHVHRPRCAEVALSDDKPWESSVAYFAVIKDEKKFRMYYRGFHHLSGNKPKEIMKRQARGEIMCYAESWDGINWEKPELGLFKFDGSDKNNIVLGGDQNKYPPTKKWQGYLGKDLNLRGDFAPFRDNNSEGVKAETQYKALIRGCRGLCQIAECRRDFGMYPFSSPDGLNWKLLSEQPVITKGKFDSQNLGFRDEVYNRYVAFVRDTRGVESPRAAGRDTEEVAQTLVRDIRMCTSHDFLNWNEPVFISYTGDKVEDLYTNGILPYERAPHILIAFPTRFYSEEVSQTAPVFMSSRDGGSTFHIYDKELITRDSPSERDGNRSNYMAHGLVRASNSEYYVYATEGYKDGISRRLRRFVYRLDGFVSLRAGGGGGLVVTRPVIFKGDVLMLNYRAGGSGSIRVAIENSDGRPLEGLGFKDCSPLTGDEIEAPVRWRGGASDIKQLEGKKVRIRFLLQNADLFSFQFRER